MNHRVRTNLTYLRTWQGKVTQRQLARATGIAQKTLSALESGQTSGIDFTTLARLCDYFGCTPNDILIVEQGFRKDPNQALISELALGISRLAAQIQPQNQSMHRAMHQSMHLPIQKHLTRNLYGSSSDEQLDCSPHAQDPWLELGERDKNVYEHITSEPVHFDVLAERTGLAAGELSATLTMLELSGIVHRVSGDWYKR
jgi:putative transcriptional regulator